MWTLTNPLHFLITKTWDALNLNANRMKQLSENKRRCLNHVCLLEQQRNHQDGKNLKHKQKRGPGHAQKCVERCCDFANKKVEQLYTGSHPCLGDHQLKQEELESVGDLSEVQTRKISHKVVWGMWQTIVKIDIIHSSHKRILTTLSCGLHGTALSTGFISRIRLCWRPWRLEINLGWSLLYLRKPNICLHQLVVQETNVSILQFYSAHGWTICSRSLGHGNWSVTFNKHTARQGRRAQEDLCGTGDHSISEKNKTKTPTEKRKREVEQLSEVDCVPTYTNSSHLLNGNLSCTSLKTTKPWSRGLSKDEVQRWDTCPEPTGSLLIGCLTESTWNQRSKSNMLTPKFTCWLFVWYHEFFDILEAI